MIDILEKTEVDTEPSMPAVNSGPPVCYVCGRPAAALTWCKQCKHRLCADHATMFPDGALCPEHRKGGQ